MGKRNKKVDESPTYYFGEKLNELIKLDLIKEKRDISISHGHGLEGYIQYLEPILTELEKYERVIKANKACKKDPFVEWEHKQIDATRYKVFLYLFYDGKLSLWIIPKKFLKKF